MSYEGDKDGEELERVNGLRTPEAFSEAYHECGDDYGCHAEGTELSEHLEYFEAVDPDFGRAMRAYCESSD